MTLDMHICPTLRTLALDLQKSRELANKHLANVTYYKKKVSLLEDEVRILKQHIRELKNAANK